MITLKKYGFKLILAAFLILETIVGYSQNEEDFEEDYYCYQESNPFVLNLLAEAKALAAKSPNGAYNKLLKAVKIQPYFAEGFYMLAEIDYQRGMTYQQKENPLASPENYFEKAVKNFKMSIHLCEKIENYAAYYYLGEYYYNQRIFKDAKAYLDTFSNINSTDFELITSARKYLDDINLYYHLIENPVNFNPQIIEEISTTNDEFLPLISPDGEMLFFTRRYFKNEFGTRSSQVEELFYSDKNINKDGTIKFTTGKKMPYPFDTEYDKGGISITMDNRHMFLTICEINRTEHTSYKNCDLFSSDLNNDKWTPLKNIGNEINTPFTWEAQPSVTSDGKVLFFASSRQGGFGGIDIYKSVKDSTGKWGEPENLGADINTEKDDKTPFIHTDSKTLYFSSDGRFGLGGFDIFYAQYIGNGRWTEPQNVGYPINTEKDNLAFVVSTNGEKIYFAAREKPDAGGWDIFTSVLDEKIRPDKVLFVKGKLSDQQKRTLKNTSIELQSIKTLKLTKGLIDPHNGKYAIAVAVMDNEDFILTVKNDDSFYESKYIHPNEKILKDHLTLDFEIRPIEVGMSIKLENIYFEVNSAEFDESSIISLNNFVEFLMLNTTLKISLFGHTDNVGESENNMELSTSRAKAVRDYLVDRGIDETRVQYKGFGETRPVANNATTKGRAANRRTEFIVTVK